MNQARLFPCYKRPSFLLRGIVLLVLVGMHWGLLHAQDAPQGPLAPPPEHHVNRVANVSEPEAPPSLPEAEIIKHFSGKEDEYILWLTGYNYRNKMIIQEYRMVCQPTGL